MKITLFRKQTKGGSFDGVLATKFGDMPLSEFLAIKLKKYKKHRLHADGLPNYTTLLANADVQHGTVYNYISGRGGITIPTLILLCEMGYELHLVAPHNKIKENE